MLQAYGVATQAVDWIRQPYPLGEAEAMTGALTDLPQFVHDMLASPPKAGEGVHPYLYRVARQLHAHRDVEQIFRLLRASVNDCGRIVPDREIWDAINNSFMTAWRPHQSGAARHMAMPVWPPRNKEKIDNIVRAGGGLYDLWETSPIRSECGIWPPEPLAQEEVDPWRLVFTPLECASFTEEIIDAVFPGNPLLCIGRSVHESATRRREVWRGRLSELPLMVPSPMNSVAGITREGKKSQRTLNNTGPRRFLVVEFDFGELARDGRTETEFGALVRAWHNAGITVADACAALLMHLAQGAPLALVLHSGNRSLHGWFYCFGQPEDKLKRFMRYAHTLGADPATWTKSQLVRIPGGVRENGKRQIVWFFNPGVCT
jgi:hypothetical protein